MLPYEVRYAPVWTLLYPLVILAMNETDPAYMQRAIDNGVDGIVTDFPGRLRAL